MQAKRGEAARPTKRRRSRDGRWRGVSALTLAGTVVIGLFAAAGYQVGNVAVARSVAPSGLDVATGPASAILLKASLLADAPALAHTPSPMVERVIPVSLVLPKGDMLIETVTTARSDRLARLISPPVAVIEKTWQTGREQRRRVAERKALAAEHRCMSHAIYFEARSESELGQLAVAKVILNRVKSPLYPNSICQVVYQNAEQYNACQFSFACNGRSDKPRPGKAWERAKSLATLAMAGEADVQVVATATHFHADYVAPHWSGAMTRLIKIGRHIFYNGT